MVRGGNPLPPSPFLPLRGPPASLQHILPGDLKHPRKTPTELPHSMHLTEYIEPFLVELQRLPSLASDGGTKQDLLCTI